MIFHLPTSRLYSIAYFCSECGELWAKVDVKHSSKWDRTTKWRTLQQFCPEHAYLDEWFHAETPPGSLLYPFILWDDLANEKLPLFLFTLPEPWLRHEFKCYLTQAEKDLTNDD